MNVVAWNLYDFSIFAFDSDFNICKQKYSAPWKLDGNARKSTANAGQLRPLTALISSLLAVYFRDLFQAQSIEHI
jgi:hypothetical protein